MCEFDIQASFDKLCYASFHKMMGSPWSLCSFCVQDMAREVKAAAYCTQRTARDLEISLHGLTWFDEVLPSLVFRHHPTPKLQYDLLVAMVDQQT